MPKLSYSEVVALRTTMRDELSKQLPKWRQLARFISPNRLKENANVKNEGRLKDEAILRNQAGRSLRIFVSGMMNGATPRARPWFNLTVNNKSKARSGAAKRYFAAVEAVLNSHFQVSNLYRILPMTYKDAGIFSNSAFAMLPHPRYGFYFYPFAVGTYSFACDAEGNTNMFTRDFSMSVRQIVSEYAKTRPGSDQIDWSNIPKAIEEDYKNARYLKTYVLTQVIVPNPHWRGDNRVLYSYDRKFQSYTYLQSAGSNLPPQTSNGFRNERLQQGDRDEFIRCAGFDYFPVITPRWEVSAEEDFGEGGPGDIALSDIKQFQQMEYDRQEAVRKLLKPPMVGPSSLRRHQSSILAGGITYVDDAGSTVGFKPAFEMDPKISELVSSQEDLKQAIRSAFYEDLFLMLSGEETKTHVSAREIDEKASERMTALAPVLGQWDQDLSSKLIYNAQLILEGMGRLPPKPQELQDEEIRPEYISILAQAAKVSAMNGMERHVAFTAQIAQSYGDPGLMQINNPEAIIREYADYVALNPSLIRDETEFANLRKLQQQQAQMQQQMQMQAQQAAVAKDMSQAKVGEGSLLDTALTAASF